MVSRLRCAPPMRRFRRKIGSRVPIVTAFTKATAASLSSRTVGPAGSGTTGNAPCPRPLRPQPHSSRCSPRARARAATTPPRPTTQPRTASRPRRTASCSLFASTNTVAPLARAPAAPPSVTPRSNRHARSRCRSVRSRLGSAWVRRARSAMSCPDWRWRLRSSRGLVADAVPWLKPSVFCRCCPRGSAGCRASTRHAASAATRASKPVLIMSSKSGAMSPSWRGPTIAAGLVRASNAARTVHSRSRSRGCRAVHPS